MKITCLSRLILLAILTLIIAPVFGEKIDPETGFPWGAHNRPKGYFSNFETGTPIRSTRAAMLRALDLLAEDSADSQKEGCRVLKNLLAYQDTNPENKTFGLWPWYIEEPINKMPGIDYNWADFIGATLVSILADYSDRIPQPRLDQTRAALDNCCRCIIKRDVRPDYTNIAYMGAAVTAAAGELLNKPEITDYARMRMKRNVDYFHEIGGFTEYNSPTYTLIILEELERILQYVKDEPIRQMAQQMRFEVWKMLAFHFHPATGQWSGPHSRAYSDILRPNTRAQIFSRVGLEYSSKQLDTRQRIKRLPCPEELKGYFTRTITQPIILHENYNNSRPYWHETGTTLLEQDLCLGSASYYTFTEQARGLIAYWNAEKRPNSDTAEPVVLTQRFFHNDFDFSSAAGRTYQNGRKTISAFNLLLNRGSMNPSLDRPKDGNFQTESLEVVYQLTGYNSSVKQLGENCFELSAGTVRAIIHPAADCTFDGQPVKWEIDQQKDNARVIGICYRGEKKTFNTSKASAVKIGVGLELLTPGEKPSEEPVKTSASSYTTPAEGNFYEVQWAAIPAPPAPFLAPEKATSR